MSRPSITIIGDETPSTIRIGPAWITYLSEHIVFDTLIDFELVKDMARKAAASKGQKARSGPLTVRVTSKETCLAEPKNLRTMRGVNYL